jgi:hypothetical protein
MAALTAQPVRRVTWPGYPTRLQVLADAELLKRHIPAAWLSNRELAAAAGVCLAANVAGCGGGNVQEPSADASRGGAAAVRAVVAPVFLHGDGEFENPRPYGYLGCVAVVAPVYLPEDEALVIIREELRRAGLSTLARDVALDGVVISGHRWREGYNWVSGYPGAQMEEYNAPLVADLADVQRRVYVEYLSEEDYYPLGGQDTGRDVSHPKLAAELGEQVRRQANGIIFGTLYDPVVFYSFGWGDVDQAESRASPDWSGLSEKEREEVEAKVALFRERFGRTEQQAREKSQESLRLQVRDFVDWLKAQGAI